VERLEKPQAGTIQQPADEQHDAVELGEEAPHLFVGQDDGQSPRPVGADHPTELADIPVEDRLVEEEQGVESLVCVEALRRSSTAR